MCAVHCTLCTMQAEQCNCCFVDSVVFKAFLQHLRFHSHFFKSGVRCNSLDYCIPKPNTYQCTTMCAVHCTLCTMQAEQCNCCFVDSVASKAFSAAGRVSLSHGALLHASTSPPTHKYMCMFVFVFTFVFVFVFVFAFVNLYFSHGTLLHASDSPPTHNSQNTTWDTSVSVNKFTVLYLPTNCKTQHEMVVFLLSNHNINIHPEFSKRIYTLYKHYTKF